MSSYTYIDSPAIAFISFIVCSKLLRTLLFPPGQGKFFASYKYLNNRLVQPVSKQTVEYHTLDSTFGFNIQILSIPDKETATTTSSEAKQKYTVIGQ